MYPEVSVGFHTWVFMTQSSKQHWRSTVRHTSIEEEAPGHKPDLFSSLPFEVFKEEVLEIPLLGSKLWT